MMNENRRGSRIAGLQVLLQPVALIPSQETGGDPGAQQRIEQDETQRRRLYHGHLAVLYRLGSWRGRRPRRSCCGRCDCPASTPATCAPPRDRATALTCLVVIFVSLDACQIAGNQRALEIGLKHLGNRLAQVVPPARSPVSGPRDRRECGCPTGTPSARRRERLPSIARTRPRPRRPGEMLSGSGRAAWM